jgi:hypothetical protein
MGDGVRMVVAGIVVGGLCLMTRAEEPSKFASPLSLSLQPEEPESVYAPPAPPRTDAGINEGAVHIDVAVGYFTDYLFRGIEFAELPSFNRNPDDPNEILGSGSEDSPTLQINAKLQLDLGKLPHPYVGVFVNYADADPISTFEEIRPTLGFDWPIRPLIFSAGYTTYLYPDRDQFETSEVWGRIQIDDSWFLHTETPMLSPYIFAAYDIDVYNGWYIEGGVSHDFVIEKTGLTLTAEAHVAYVHGVQLFETVFNQEDVNGFQHYQLGLIGTYSLNKFFNFPTRYGEWNFQGFLYYTDSMEDDLLADTQLWGGVGVLFKY